MAVMICLSCGWSGRPTFYDIGDGPEWCCPGCDQCYPSNPVVGPDGLTDAERSMKEMADKLMAERHPGAVKVGEIIL